MWPHLGLVDTASPHRIITGPSSNPSVVFAGVKAWASPEAPGHRPAAPPRPNHRRARRSATPARAAQRAFVGPVTGAVQDPELPAVLAGQRQAPSQPDGEVRFAGTDGMGADIGDHPLAYQPPTFPAITVKHIRRCALCAPPTCSGHRWSVPARSGSRRRALPELPAAGRGRKPGWRSTGPVARLQSLNGPSAGREPRFARERHWSWRDVLEHKRAAEVPPNATPPGHGGPARAHARFHGVA